MRLTLHRINQNGNKFCGPSIVSALAGIGTKEAAAVIRAQTGSTKAVKGTHSGEIREALRALGFSMQALPPLAVKVSLREWVVRYPQSAQSTFLVVAGRHWIVTQGTQAVCGLTIEPVQVDAHPHARRRVTSVYKLAQVETIDPETIVPKRPREIAGEATARRKAKALAVEHGIEIERDGSSLVVWPPASVSEEDDPHEGDHYVDYWTEALAMCVEYAAIIKAKAAQ
jgi:hypothetical protein